MKPLLTRALSTAAVSAAAVALSAGPALAAQSETDPVDPSFSTLDALLLFVGVPLLAALVISLLVYAPHLARRPRYRPGRPYEADPLWLGADPATESSAGQLTAAPVLKEPPGGGASAGW